ncbi:hypothetical protein SELMODRAFT_406883 [Selaginella moellendorffii]|uniref:Glycosyltransferase family 92 protein n=1 Tax=Selaginella moellendorffii TaxID=88036 RepID=D8R387_SELML|nr:galactan beta-1,4-galactosyltransferase GALS1 [Selaginella moellendorffii]EFJ32903.1 hypothetical protein SELMODRAFT_406883 [Selaginella moellendorffii]|eukprot:XP_002965483.1 galactan beta-1,4-galactosyltransferase GALS1 [Selaginella moellendorffii]
MAAFHKAMICRIWIVLLVTLLWIGLWYSRISPATSDLAAHRKDLHRFGGNLARNSSFSKFWEVEDGQLTADLIHEVVEELEKIRDGTPGGVVAANRKEPCDERRDLARERGFRRIGETLHAFVLSSVARFSLEEFTAVGLVSIQLRGFAGNPLQSCAWVPKAGSSSVAAALAASNDSSVIWGNSWLGYVNESHTEKTFYDVGVVKCSFEEPVGANGEGGFLVLNMTRNSSPPPLVDHSGIIEQSYVPVFQELPEEISSIQFEGPFRFDYAYCSPLLTPSKNVSAKYVKEWLMYHQGLWSESHVHYFFYDAGGIDSRLLEVFQPLMEKKFLTVIDMRELVLFESAGDGHQLVINDCLQRSRFLATWAFFWDLDEYLQLVNSTSMAALLRSYESSPWISLANLVWSRTYCKETSAEDEWAVERMRFRLRYPTCGDEQRAETCHGVEGHRKWIANPRKVLVASIHRTVEPEWNGEILRASIARLNHFHGLAVEGSANSSCWIVKKLDQVNESSLVDGWWLKDESFAVAAMEQHRKGL